MCRHTQQSAMVVDLAAAGHLIGDMAQTLAFGYVVHALMRGGMKMVLPPTSGPATRWSRCQGSCMPNFEVR